MAVNDASSLLDWLHWGVIVSTVFFGVTIVQGWIYFNDNSDRWRVRLLVMTLILFDFATTCLNSLILRHYSTPIFTPVALLSTARIVDVQVVLSSVVVFLVQLFFASRVYLLNRNSWYAPAIITGCAIGALASMILVVVYNIRHNLVMDLSSNQLKLDTGLAIGFSGTADLVATIALCWRISSGGTGAKRTKTMLHQLLLYFITRGLLVTLTEVAHVIIYELQAASLHWMPLQLVSCKLYVNTTLAILNARTSLRIQMDADAMDASKCMPPFRLEDHLVSQHRDMEAQSFTITDKLKLSNIGNRVFNAKVDLGVSASSHSATTE